MIQLAVKLNKNKKGKTFDQYSDYIFNAYNLTCHTPRVVHLNNWIYLPHCKQFLMRLTRSVHIHWCVFKRTLFFFFFGHWFFMRFFSRRSLKPDYKLRSSLLSLNRQTDERVLTVYYGYLHESVYLTILM